MDGTAGTPGFYHLSIVHININNDYGGRWSCWMMDLTAPFTGAARLSRVDYGPDGKHADGALIDLI